MKVFTYPVGEMQTNCHIIADTAKCLIIDPGDSADFILEELQRKRLEPVAILATHGHFDHVLAAGEIQLSFSIPFYIHKDDAFLLARAGNTGKHFLSSHVVSVDIVNTQYLPIGALSVEPFSFEVIHTPGHTPGSCSFYFSDEGVVFTGDTLFKDGLGEYTHAYSNKALLNNSVRVLRALPEGTEVYSGHGEEFVIIRNS